jgi:hypothetical protein
MMAMSPAAQRDKQSKPKPKQKNREIRRFAVTHA